MSLGDRHQARPGLGSHRQSHPAKIVAAGEWKTSLVMDDDMRDTIASLSQLGRTA